MTDKHGSFPIPSRIMHTSFLPSKANDWVGEQEITSALREFPPGFNTRIFITHLFSGHALRVDSGPQPDLSSTRYARAIESA
jgi:hypothetical protein